MKRLIFLCVFAVIAIAATVAWGAAPANNGHVESIGDVVIDSEYTDDQWELIDSIITIKTDTCYTVYTITGIAVLDPGDKFYFGYTDGYSLDSLPADTFIVSWSMRHGVAGYVPFTFQYVDSLVSETDANDTIYFMGAVGGSSTSEKVTLQDVVIEARIVDADGLTSS